MATWISGWDCQKRFNSNKKSPKSLRAGVEKKSPEE